MIVPIGCPAPLVGRLTLVESPEPAAAEGSLQRRDLGQLVGEDWMVLFDRVGVPASPVWFVEEMLTNPQVVENGYILEVDHDLVGPQWVAAPPLRMSDSPLGAQGASPPLGRDTRKWLRELGYADSEVDALALAGAVNLGMWE